MAFTKTIVAVIVAFTSFQVAVTSPMATEKVYPEVIPGPGLPSLVSLNLTSAQLYEMALSEGAKALLARAADFDAECGPNDSAYTDVNDIITCYHYLQAAGQSPCTAGANYAVATFCAVNAAKVTGQSVTGGSSSSYCQDAASAVLYTINSCTRPDQSCAGYQAAGGNGNLIIGSVNKNY